MRDGVQRLIEHNHSLDAIGDYTFDQFVDHLETVDRGIASARVEFVSDVLAAISVFGEGDGLKQHFDDLSFVAIRESIDEPAKPTRRNHQR